MKHTRLFISVLTLLIAGYTVNAQKLNLIEGDNTLLKSEKTIGLEFTYDSMRVGKYEEKNYIQKKVTEMNKKEPGKGDGWATKWLNARKENYEPKFKEEFEKSSEKKIDSGSKYTLIFHTTFTEPGFNTGGIMVHKNPEISGEVWIVETGNRAHVIEKLTIEKVVGREGYEFDTGRHLEGAYGLAAKQIGLFLKY